MITLRILELCYYPIKSCAGVSVDQLVLDRYGPEMDRRYMLVDQEGTFIRQSSVPGMARIQPEWGEVGLLVRYAGESPLLLPHRAPGTTEVIPVQVWEDECLAEDQGPEAAAWFTDKLGVPCRLVKVGAGYQRQVKSKYGHPGEQVSFADSTPCTIGVRESLEDLNRRITAGGGTPITMDRFRPSIVVESAGKSFPINGSVPMPDQYGDRMITLPEDTWSKYTLYRDGYQLTFRGVKPTARCAITTIDQTEGAKVDGEPLRTLATYRFRAARQSDPKPRSKVLFCWNLVHEYRENVPMVLKVGDILEVE
jgi:uncharacterized protein YcbX